MYTNYSEHFWKHCIKTLKTNQNLNDYLKICRWYAKKGYEDPDYYAMEYIEIL